MVDMNDEYVWIVVVGFILAFILCLGIGANDVANAFGTSVGAKVLTLREACILGTIFETLGAVFLGANVSETVRKGIIDVELYENKTEEFLLGNVAALGGSAIWLTIATVFKVPVSTTHSIVGATVGFALVVNGSKGIDWVGLGKIVASWFISPVLSGLVTLGMFALCDYAILRNANALERGLAWLPIFYASTCAINLFSIFYDGPERFHFDKIPLWGVFILSFGSGILIAVGVRIYAVPRLRRLIVTECTDHYESEKAKMLYGTPTRSTTFRSSKSTDQLVASHNHSSVTLKSYTNEGFKGDEIVASASQVSLTTATPRHNFIPPSSGTDTPPSGRNVKFAIGGEGAADSPALTRKDAEPTENGATGNGYVNVEANGALSTISANVDSQTSPKHEYDNVDSAAMRKRKEERREEEEDMDEENEVKDAPEVARLFSFLQILTAIFSSFAHGGNDVSNGIGPLISIWLVSISDDVTTSDMTPLWLLFYGGVGISVGLWVWGRGVIETLGEDLTTVTPSSGFCIELGAATTVLIASNVGIPVSSTHCKVGSVVSAGRMRSKDNVDWSLFRNIIFSWVVTLPAAGCFSAAIMALLLLSV